MKSALQSLVIACVVCACAPAHAEVVEGRAAEERHLAFSRSLARDLELPVAGVRRVLVSLPVAGEWVRGTGAEVVLVEGEGAEARTLRLQRIKFATPEEAQAFFANTSASGDAWGMELRGVWIVRATGSVLEDPELSARALSSAWAHGPAAGRRDALFVKTAGGYVVEDWVGSPVVAGVIDRRFQDATERSDRGLLAEGETLSADRYVSTAGTSYASFERRAELRRGVLGPLSSRAQLEAFSAALYTPSRCLV